MTKEKKEFKFELERSPNFGIQDFVTFLYSADSSPAFIMTLGEKDERETYFLPRSNIPKIKEHRILPMSETLEKNDVTKNYDFYKRISNELNGFLFQPEEIDLKKEYISDYMADYIEDQISLDKESFFKVFSMLWNEEAHQGKKEFSTETLENADGTSLKMNEFFPFSEHVNKILLGGYSSDSYENVRFTYPIYLNYPSNIKTSKDIELNKNLETLPSSDEGQEVFVKIAYSNRPLQPIYRSSNNLKLFKMNLYTGLSLTRRIFPSELEIPSKQPHQHYYTHRVEDELISTIADYAGINGMYVRQENEDLVIFSDNDSFRDVIDPTKKLQDFYKVVKKAYDVMEKEAIKKTQKKIDDLTSLLEE